MIVTEFARLLFDLLGQGHLALPQVQSILDAMRAGLVTADQLPLPLALARIVSDDDVRAAVSAVAGLMGGVYAGRLVNGGGRIPLSVRQRVRDALRSAYERLTGRLARRLTATGNIRIWHRNMIETVRGHILQQFIAGVARVPRALELTPLVETVREQLTYLYRFAGHMAARVISGVPASVGYVWQRSVQYAGAGWRAWHEGNEQAVGSGDGLVCVYVARDDGRVCGPCASAASNGPYLPGSNHAWPGSVCLGRGHCRCTLRYVVDWEAWQRLTGQRVTP